MVGGSVFVNCRLNQFHEFLCARSRSIPPCSASSVDPWGHVSHPPSPSHLKHNQRPDHHRPAQRLHGPDHLAEYDRAVDGGEQRLQVHEQRGYPGFQSRFCYELNPLFFIGTMSILRPPCSTEGRLPETSVGGTGCGACGRASSARTREASGLRLGVLRPPARSWLTDEAQMPRRKARPKDRKTPRWSAERRAGQRHWPVIPGDPGIGPTARRATGCGVPPAPVGALLPLVSARVTRRKAYPAPHKKYGQRSVG